MSSQTTLLKVLVDHAPGILSLVGSDTRILYVSAAVEQITLHRPADLVGLSFIQFVHPEDVDPVTKTFSDILACPDVARTQRLRFHTAKGGWVHLEAVGTNFLGNPDINGVLFCARDISDRVLVETDLESRKALVERGLEELIAAVSATVDARDPYTAGHQRRVAAIARRIGEKLDLSQFALKGLTLAATIHDLGKITIPAEILTAPRRLKPAEYELMKTHAEAGYQIVKDVHFPWPIAEIVRQHHEQIDGTGYPRGLKSDQILLEARILAVADTLEAMAFHRPYRAGLGLDAGLEEIERKRGTSYDAAVVDACLKLFRDEGFQLPEK